MPLVEVRQNRVLIQLKGTPHISNNVQGLIKELFQLIEPGPATGTDE